MGGGPAYARAVTSATPRVRQDHVDRFVAFRQVRAAVLTDSEPLELAVVVGETALRLDVGDPAILQDQYRHLIRLAALPNVELQVLCPEDGIHSGFTGAFAILGFDHAHSVGYVELQDDAVYIHVKSGYADIAWQRRTCGTSRCRVLNR
ncbi:DUF5753 domain-containing protein [Saccharopolyspora hattusasensis]|uniref:DUF5753 domain-containing protein n=1 Tax=Saccharopolyspora hattusasensis TaxID=1128679 RepID=UPI003D9512BA